MPTLEGYYERPLTDREKRIVRGHVAMLFMDPCPLEELTRHDDQFADRMLAKVNLDDRRN